MQTCTWPRCSGGMGANQKQNLLSMPGHTRIRVRLETDLAFLAA